MPLRSSSAAAAAHWSRSVSCSALVGQPNQARSPFAAWAVKLIGLPNASPLDVVAKMFQPHQPHEAGLVEHLKHEPRVLLELRDEILRRHLVEIDLAGLERAERGLLVADVLEDHPVDLDDLAAGGA